MPTKKQPSAKRVVYLWGAGATHAEGQRLGSTVSLLMRDSPLGEGITTRILRRTGKRAVSSFSGEGEGSVDIEKLISLLVASGNKAHVDLAEQLRENYFAELRASLYNANVLNNPDLAIQLFTMHANPNFQREIELLTGVITTNHDGLLQLASQQVYLKNVIPMGFITDGHFADYKTPEKVPADSDLTNPFAYWLSEKREFHRNQLRAGAEDAPAEVPIGAPA
jgi:hypothetical protein